MEAGWSGIGGSKASRQSAEYLAVAQKNGTTTQFCFGLGEDAWKGKNEMKKIRDLRCFFQ